MGNSKLSNGYLLELQRKFRNKQITEKDIPKDQLADLKELYHKQIEYLEKSIESDKQKILEIRKRIKNKK